MELDLAHLGSSLNDLCGDLGLAANANTMIFRQFSYELFFRPCLFVMVDLKPLGTECLDGILTDILENQQL